MENENTAGQIVKKPPVKRNMPIRRFTCPDELWDSADRVAKSEDRSVSWLIRKAVEEYIDRHRATKRAAKQAAFDAEFDRANAGDHKVIASKKSKSGKA